MSPRKWIFLVSILVASVSIVLAVLAYQSYAAKKRISIVGGSLDIWVVGEDASGYDPIITAFKAQRPEYQSTQINVTKFLTQADYEKTLINAFSDDRAPDIFMVPAYGGEYLENKVTALPPNRISVDSLSTTYQGDILRDLTIEGVAKDANGNNIKILGLKGVVMGYELLGMYYNSVILPNPPTSISVLEGLLSRSSDGTYPLGYTADSRTPQIGLILTQAFAQNNINTYAGLSDKGVTEIVKRLAQFAQTNVYSESGGGQSQESFSDAMGVDGVMGDTSSYFGTVNSKDELPALHDIIGTGGVRSTSLADLFAQGKIGALIGTPRLLLDIQLAIKKAGEANALGVSNFATAFVPTLGPTQKPILFYSYLALSRDTNSPVAAQDFLTFLSTPQAQKLYIESFPYMISPTRSLALEQSSRTLVASYPRTKLSHFMLKDGAQVVQFNPGLFLEYSLGLLRLISSSDSPDFGVLVRYIDCQKNQLISFIGLQNTCELP